MNPSLDKNCLEAALRLLTRRDHSCMELKRKLKKRNFDGDQIRRTIVECQRLNYLNDEKFAHGYSEQLQRKGYGPHLIRQKLASKGVAPQLIAHALAPVRQEAKERDVCRAVLVKKLKTEYRRSSENPPMERLYRFLSGRGFTPGTIRHTLAEVPTLKED
jgi:regulatory protein